MITVLAIKTIVSDPQVMDGWPSIAGTKTTVAEVAEAIKYHGRDPQEVAAAFDIPAADIFAAYAYYLVHYKTIDAQISALRSQAAIMAEQAERQRWLNSLRPQIDAFCARWKITEFALFGDVTSEEFTPNSEIDVLATFTSEVDWTLWDKVKMKDELRAIFGRKANIMSRTIVELSRDKARRRDILDSAQTVHVIA